VNIAGVEIGHGQPCRFVAKISNNHNGDRDRCGRLIAAAKAAGADIVKFQCYSPDELVALRGDGPAPEPWGSQGWTMRALYEKARTPFDWFPKIAHHCARVGMPWFSSVFGPESLSVLEANGCPAYKIARLDNRDDWLAQAVVATGRPVIVSEAQYFEAAVVPALRLYCPPGYPQDVHGMFATQFVDEPWNRAGAFDGFSFHGTDPLPCVVAATLGAKIIEAHVQLDDEPSELEAHVSLSASQFQAMVTQVRRIEGMFA
jgi:pseudaminic acid synthase